MERWAEALPIEVAAIRIAATAWMTFFVTFPFLGQLQARLLVLIETQAAGKCEGFLSQNRRKI